VPKKKAHSPKKKGKTGLGKEQIARKGWDQGQIKKRLINCKKGAGKGLCLSDHKKKNKKQNKVEKGRGFPRRRSRICGLFGILK